MPRADWDLTPLIYKYTKKMHALAFKITHFYTTDRFVVNIIYIYIYILICEPLTDLVDNSACI